jgi:hypothetical protein
MTKTPRATIVFYNEDTQQVQLCTVSRSQVQLAIDRAGAITIPPHAEETPDALITDEDARALGAIAILIQAKTHPELRERIQLTTGETINWGEHKPPKA